MRYIHTHKEKRIKSLRLCTGKKYSEYVYLSMFTNVSIEMWLMYSECTNIVFCIVWWVSANVYKSQDMDTPPSRSFPSWMMPLNKRAIIAVVSITTESFACSRNFINDILQPVHFCVQFLVLSRFLRFFFCVLCVSTEFFVS